MKHRIVLGVSGSVAAYRACDLARELMREGYEVRVCLTDAAEKFVTRALFEALTTGPCLIDTFEEPDRGRMAHIDWARQASLLLVAPASANTINKLAAGIGDDMLTTLALAYDGPILIAPAMNPTMWSHQTVKESIDKLLDRGVEFVDPAEGEVACGEQGRGKFAAIPDIVARVHQMVDAPKPLAGKKVLLTNGPTQEAIDDVRFLTNRSSGRMGAALAEAAHQLGAEVTIVSGPVHVRYPVQASIQMVKSAEEMLAEASKHAVKADWIIGVAAVADYRPAHPVRGKIRRTDEPLHLEMVPNPDIIASLAKANPSAKTIGFAAEPTMDLGEAADKLERKGLHAVVHNHVGDTTIGFESTDNQVTLIRRTHPPLTSEKMSKARVARWLLEQLLTD